MLMPERRASIRKRLAQNTLSTLCMELISLVCAFILPHLVITGYGSEYSGLTTSVTQFLSFVVLLRGGVGGVTRAALYKPLLEGDIQKVSGIVRSTEEFMRKVALIFLMLLVVFAAVYPFLIDGTYDWLYAFSLVLILGATTFIQYFFGITYSMLLQADQRLYVYNAIQTLATVLNTALASYLMLQEVDYRLVKLASAGVFALIPLFLSLYVRQKYRLDRLAPLNSSALAQRWDAFAHQAAAFVTSNTDLMVLTIITNLYYVSVYSVYFMIFNGVKRLVSICTSGVESALGAIIASGNRKKLIEGFRLTECATHMVSSILFSCAAILAVPFILIYTDGVTDVSYNEPMLSLFMSIAFFIMCVRLPYETTVNVAGHFKQTRNGAIVEALLNIGLSVPLTMMLGLVGVVAGTIIASGFRTTQLALYAAREITKLPSLDFWKRAFVSLTSVLVVAVLYLLFDVGSLLSVCSNYYEWAVYGAIAFVAVSLIVLTVNAIFYKDILCRMAKRFVFRAV